MKTTVSKTRSSSTLYVVHDDARALIVQDEVARTGRAVRGKVQRLSDLPLRPSLPRAAD